MSQFCISRLYLSNHNCPNPKTWHGFSYFLQSGAGRVPTRGLAPLGNWQGGWSSHRAILSQAGGLRDKTRTMASISRNRVGNELYSVCIFGKNLSIWMENQADRNRSPPRKVGVPSARIAAKMASPPGKGRGLKGLQQTQHETPHRPQNWSCIQGIARFGWKPQIETEEQRWLKFFNDGEQLDDTALPTVFSSLKLMKWGKPSTP